VFSCSFFMVDEFITQATIYPSTVQCGTFAVVICSYSSGAYFIYFYVFIVFIGSTWI
jgi:hypothetical protein